MRTVHFVNANMGLQSRDSLLKTVDPPFTRIIIWHTGILKAGAVLLTFVSLISFGSSSRVIKGDLFKDDEINLRSGPIQHYVQKSFCYRKGDLDNCIDFSVRSKALNLEQLLLADRRGHQQLLNMQSGTKRFCSPAILSRSFGQTKLDCVSSWELLLRSSMVSSSNSPVFGSTSHAVLHASILRSAMAFPKGTLPHLAPIYQPSYDASDPQLHAPKASLPLVTTLCHRLLCPSTSYLRGAPSISNAILASSPRALDNSHLLLTITTSPPASQLSSHFSTNFPPYVPQPPPIQSPYVSSLSPSPFAVQSSESLVHSAGPDLSSIKPINARRSASVSTSLPDEFMPVGQIMRSPPSSLYPVMPKKFSAIWVLDPMPPVSQAPKQGSEHLGFRQAYTPLLTSSYFVPPAFLPEDFPMSFVSPTPADNKPLIGSPHRDPQQAPPRSVSSVSFVSPPPSSVITQRDTLVQSATSLHASGTSKLLMPPTQNTQHPGESRTGTSALPSPAPLLVVAPSSIQCHDMCSPEPSSQAFQPSRSLHSERITPILATRRPLSVAIPPSVPSHDRWSIEPSFQSFDPSDKISFARVLPPLNARSSPRLLGDLSPALPPAPHSRTSVSPAGPAPVHINFAPPFRKRRQRPPLTSTPATEPASRNATSPVSSGPSPAARERSRGHAAVAMSPESQGQPGLASSIISPSPSHHRDVQGSVAPSPRITPFRSRWRKPAKPVAASPMIFRSPPPNQDCATMSCTQPLTSTPLDSPCGCVLPMQVELELGVAPYAFFPLVPELAAEIAAGTYLKQSQVRIMGANADSQDQGKTFVNIDLVPLGEKFDYTTALLTYERFWQKKVIINETLFGDYRVIFVHYSGLPPSPPSSFSDGTHNGGPNRNIGGFGSEQPLGVDIRKRSEKLGGGTIAVVALSSAIAVVICLGAVWFILLKCSNQSRLPPAVAPMFSSSVTKKSGGGSILSTSMASSTSLSFASSMATYTGSAKTFTLAELERATDRFNSRNILGEGGFGRVYRGVLEDGTQLAVKVLTRDDQQGGREFTAEVEMLSRLHHRNLVKLVGICTEEHNRSLIYELIPNGSVESHLHGQDKKNAPLDWDARMKIALGAARGLAYLHEDSNPRVIHRDFKASNILLEDDFTPKVSDFGLAKAASDEGSEHISTRVMGTFGYVAPEYAMTGHLLVKSDVYSYGVVLLELLSGRKPVDMSQPPGQENLVTWARPLLTNKEGLETLVDPALGGRFSFDNMARVAAIASMCVQPEVSHRPFMGEVVQALKLVYNDSDASNGGGSGNYSQRGDSPGPDNDLKDESDQTWWRSTQYVPDSTSFVTIDYDSGPLQAQELGTERPLSASALLSSSGRFIGQPSGSFRRHSSSGPLRTNRSRPPWYRVRGLTGGSRSEHGFTRHFEMGLYRDVHELWP